MLPIPIGSNDGNADIAFEAATFVLIALGPDDVFKYVRKILIYSSVGCSKFGEIFEDDILETGLGIEARKDEDILAGLILK